MTYEIKVKEWLDTTYASWFDELTITHTVEGNTQLKGLLVDQAALYGVLERCRNLGLTLISVNLV
ncbi:MAG: hypothetical protein AAF614_05110 [Chloroflexota bacterium]